MARPLVTPGSTLWALFGTRVRSEGDTFLGILWNPGALPSLGLWSQEEKVP